MFAALTFDRDPLTFSWGALLSMLNSWTQITGGFAMVGLVLWLIAHAVSSRGSPEGGNALVRAMATSLLGVLAILLLGPVGAVVVFFFLVRPRLLGADVSAGNVNLAASGSPRGALTTVLFVGSFVWAGFGYLLLLALYLPDIIAWSKYGNWPPPAEVPAWRRLAQSILWTAAGGSAVFAVLVPILADLAQISPRRIWAVARLSFKEAVRRKVLWVFLGLLLVVLFGSWFIPNKPEDQVRTYVQVVFLAMALLMLTAAVLIAAFGLPDDIRHQTIHTVLTKPVQRFEIFLGRFLGYVTLMTLVLAGVTALSLLYVMRNIGPEAAEESLKAREAYYGNLHFLGTKDEKTGENVGREWEYRGYIEGRAPNSTAPTQYAVWSFPEVPSPLLDRDKARLEFTLDIYRTHKGVEGQGVFCTFIVDSWRFDPDDDVMKERYEKRKKELEDQGKGGDALANALGEEFGHFEYPSMEIKDFHTQWIEVPKGVLANAARPEGKEEREQRGERPRRRGDGGSVAPLRVRVRCDSKAQFVGMAKYDLYWRLDHDQSEAWNKVRFSANFFKGSFGLWLRLCLILGLAVAISTYLSGVITLATSAVLYVLGFIEEFITEVALRKNVGGGPMEAAVRMVSKPGGQSLAMPMEESTTKDVTTWVDTSFAWTLRRVMDVIPDVARYSFTDFVAEGVSISGGQMLMSFLLLLAYLLPWAVLAYYLLKWREVASST
jgi:hypothetical protein